MKKIIFILLSLLSHSLSADVEVRRYGDGYMFRFIEAGNIYCWGMPDFVDLNYFNDQWTTVPQTAIARNWPTMTGGMANECSSIGVYRTYGGILFEPISGKVYVDLPAGIVCGEQASTLSPVRIVHWQDKIGLAVCVISE